MQSIIIHAHFYQPPREDPWLEVVEREHTAAPWHDWNVRIEHECYRPMVAARLTAPDARITRITNLLARISFNAGATLLDWLEREAPATYADILRADSDSLARLGHGNALAMPYHHLILPLASRRDKVTEVRWGIRDFRKRFGRDPEGMWLPETAADEETLDVLAQEGIHFTILAPHQITPKPLYGLPGVVRTSGHHRLAVFTYDGTLAHDVAFGPLMRDPAAWAERMVLPPDDVGGPKLVAFATDGETYGHHQKFGEMALAAMLERLRTAPVRVENFASFLAAHPPRESVALTGASSWSCSHGIERWRADCGCRLAEGTSQAWRTPLRDALDWLKGELDARFEAEATPLLGDAWATLDRCDDAAGSPVRARELMEMQRHALRMFTSCGWFFDDIAGLEPLQCLRDAARAIEFTGDGAPGLLAELRERLAIAQSNDSAAGDGATLLATRVLPAFAPDVRAAAGVAALTNLVPDQVPPSLGVFDVVEARADTVTVRQRRTGRESRFLVSVRGRAAADLLVEVATTERRSTATLTLTDLPETSREALRWHAQASLLPAVLDREARDAVAAGVVSYAQALQQSMLRHLDGEAMVADVDALGAALDLLALDRRPVPFDVQTRFYRLYCAASPAGRARLAVLLDRFGFSDTLDDGA